MANTFKPTGQFVFESSPDNEHVLIMGEFTIPKTFAIRLVNTCCSEPEKYNAAIQYYFRSLLEQATNSEVRSAIYANAYNTFAQLYVDWEFSESGISPILVEVMSSFFKGRDVVEFGCGKAQLAKSLASVFRSYIGVEVSNSYLQSGIKDCRDLSNMRFICTDLLSLDMGSEVADVVYSNDVVEHIFPDELEIVLKNAYRTLRTGGHIVTLTPSRYFGPFDGSRVYKTIGERSEGLHLKEYSYADLREAYARAGFGRIRALPFALTAGAWLSKYLPFDLKNFGIDSRFKEMFESSEFLRRRLSRVGGLWTVFLWAEKMPK